MRQLLAVNDSSIGLRMLDDMAAALINEQDRAAATLKTRVQILPLPSRQASTVVALPHSDFTDATVPAAGPAAVPQKRASLGTPAKGSKAKNPRSSTWSSTETTPPTLDFELSPDTPATVRQAIETIYAKAVAELLADTKAKDAAKSAALRDAFAEDDKENGEEEDDTAQKSADEEEDEV
ncbi:hypothetical protein PF002_g23121 [Phytophthora fragariae]|uniref:Uncharacterized protein n=1 Tax=Phytophthora fragariae TaxID=53985 RepID=A0A6A3X5A8_9STRA|nr:hypothetical protein PF002_g23121 [Phytophthora fragariae]